MNLLKLNLILIFFILYLANPSFSQTDGFYPFTMDWKSSADSPASVSFLLDAPAGKYGFIESRDGHTVYPDGRRFRMWGVNMGLNIIFPPKESASLIASHLARIGVNCVRIHFADCTSRKGSKSLIDIGRNDTRHLDAETLDRFDYLFSELKKRGIYIYFEITGGRAYKVDDNVKDHDILVAFSPVIYFDPRIRELQKEYLRQLLTHRNPYTGLEFRNDPALVILEMVNETSLVGEWLVDRLAGENTTKNTTGEVWGDLPPSYAQDLTFRYNKWLENRLSPAELKELRTLSGVSNEQPVPRLRKSEFSEAPKIRFYNELQFYMDVERDYFLDMQRFLKDDIGVGSLISGTNDHNHGVSGYPLLASTSQLDLTDGHVYWNHPQSTVDPKTKKTMQKVQNKPMVDDPFNSTVVQLSRSAFAGKPFTVSEVNHPFPNEHACEGIPILSAYAAFQDWDGIFWFVLGHEDPVSRLPKTLNSFDLSMNARAMAQLASGALVFLRSDVKPALQTVNRTYSFSQVFESSRLPQIEKPYFTPGFPLSLPLTHGTRISSLTGPPTKQFENDKASPLVSDTKELNWNYGSPGKGYVSINTAKTQGIVGFNEKTERKLNNLSVIIQNPFSAIVLNSLDNEPIDQSGKLLLTTGGKVANTGMSWHESRTWLTDSGKAPICIEPVRGLVTLHGLKNANNVKVQALNTMGQPFGKKIEVKNNSGNWQFAIGDEVTSSYHIEVIR